MEATDVKPKATETTSHKIRAADFQNIFNQFGSTIKVLSLDCFDTLLWRKTATPLDVFFDMQQRPTFKKFGITAIQRITAEAQARHMAFVQHGTYEVTINDIYRIGFPFLDQEQQNALVEDELNTEMATCYAFPPLIELIRQAHARGMKVIIISSTYLSESQLRRLLKNALPDDAMAAINMIFCSCDYKLPKTGELYQQALLKLSVPAQTVLHIGDNHIADLEAPRAAGLHAFHFVQYDSTIAEILRMQATAVALADPNIRYNRSLSSPYRGMFATANFSLEKPESIIGYLSMGQIMYAFARLIIDDVNALKKAGKQPKVLFVMRDGYLPGLACEALAGNSIGKQIRISRFSATAASFRSQSDVNNYLMETISTLPLDYICHQLLLPDETAKQIIQLANTEPNPAFTFCKLILQNDTLEFILKNSAAYLQRLKSYLQKEADIAPGDTLIFVDIGYVGTAQQLLTPVLKDELKIDTIIGRYLLTLNTANWQSSRRGLIDASWCDDRTIEMLSSSFALIEEICCSGDDSVIDYDETGNPIYSKSLISAEQHAKIKLIQHECVRFIKEAKQFFKDPRMPISQQDFRDAALAELGRRIFLPTGIEIAYLQGFHHDKNRGTAAAFCILTKPEDALMRLRKQGLLFKNQHPYLLRSAGLELTLVSMVKRRIGFQATIDDLSLRREWLTVIVIYEKSFQQLMCAAPTYDGYFSLWIPIHNRQIQVGILFGLHYEYFEIDSAELISATAFLSDVEPQYAEDASNHIALNDMSVKNGRLFQCLSMQSALMFAPPAKPGDNNKYVFRIIFRPIIKRETGVT